jgi:phosphoribosylformylglycinamidine cyclo-ligase
MYRTLNMGIGMVLVVASGQADRAVSRFARLGQRAWVIGEVVRGRRGVSIA